MSRIDTHAIAQHVEKSLEKGEDTPDSKALASQSNYSIYHFSRLFKQQMQLRLRDYLAAKKIESSVKAIVEGKSITHALLDAGFNSTGSFSNTFKIATGLSPKQYQQQIAFFYQFINDFFYNNDATIIPYRPTPSLSTLDPALDPALAYPLNISINNKIENTIIFVALYKKAMPTGAPEQGFALLGQTKLSLTHMPAGDYYLMACEIKRTKNPAQYFALGNARRALRREPITFPLTTPQSITLMLRERYVDDPPINVNLPKLLFDAVNAHSKKSK